MDKTSEELGAGGLLALSYRDMEEYADSHDGAIMADAYSALRHVCQKAAYVQEYLDMRHGHGCGDQGHADAAKSARRVLQDVRKALGYAYPERGIPTV